MIFILAKSSGGFLNNPVPASILEKRRIFIISAGCVAEYLPAEESIQSEFGEFRRTTEITGEYLLFRRNFVIYKADIPEEKYESFKSFYNSVARADRQKIIIAKSVATAQK